MASASLEASSAPSAALTAAQTFHRRALPPPAIEFSSLRGQKIFGEALAAGTMGGFFRLIEQFHTQDEPAFCGLGTLTMVLNALNVDPGRPWKGPWRWFHEGMLSCCEPLEKVKERGIAWPSWLCIARCNGVYVEAHRADELGGDLESFRKLVCAASCQPIGCASENGAKLKVLVVSYSRIQFGQTGDGHYSPIGGYHAGSDLVLVLDVARFKHPPHWVPLTEMYASMQRIDQETSRSRGFALLSPQRERASWLSLAYRQPACGSCGFYSISDSFLHDLQSAFSKALTGSNPLPTADGVSAAREVVRRAMAFCEGPLMPLTVVCPPANPEETACAGKERAARAETVQALQQACANFDRVFGSTWRDVKSQTESFGGGLAMSGLVWAELSTAILLSLDLCMWTSALCPSAGRSAMPATDGREEEAALAEPPGGRAAWGVIQPLLELEGLPAALQPQVASLRAQFSDLLTRGADREFVSSCCSAKVDL